MKTNKLGILLGAIFVVALAMYTGATYYDCNGSGALCGETRLTISSSYQTADGDHWSGVGVMVQPIYYTSVSGSLSAIDDGQRQFEDSCYDEGPSASASCSTSVSTDGSHTLVSSSASSSHYVEGWYDTWSGETSDSW